MPCYDGRENERIVYQETGKNASRLCAILSVLEKRGILSDVIKEADWKEAGLSSKGLLNWWEDHKAEDRRRRRAEAARKEKERRRALLISQLSPAQRELLGVK